MSGYVKNDQEIEFLEKLYTKEMREVGYMDRGVLEDAILEWKNKEILALKEELKRERECVDKYSDIKNWLHSGFKSYMTFNLVDENMMRLDLEKCGADIARQTQAQRKIEL